MINRHNLFSFLSNPLKVVKSILLTTFILAVTVSSAKAWDIWLVTSQGRIIVIRDVETLPIQEDIITHNPVPDSDSGDFGDIGFAPDGNLYGISMASERDANLYAINLNTGAVSPSATGPFDFEWGNALAFDVTTGRGYTGGGLESWSPYELLKRFRYFDAYNPATSATWYDMSANGYPSGGFAGDFAFANSKAYAIWGIWNGIAYEHYLLEITLDAAKNFISYTNLGQTEPAIGEGIWGLASDGQTLYTTTPTALYRVDIAGNSVAYTKIMNYALNAGEQVNGASSIWTDLSLSHIVDNPTPDLNSQILLTTTVHNDGPYAATTVFVELLLPMGYEYVQNNPSVGTYNSAAREWDIGNLTVGATETLEIMVTVRETGTLESRAEITHAGQGDPDSHPRSSYAIDDIGDGLTDDDEDTATVISTLPVPDVLPLTGFPMGRITSLSAQAENKAYTSTEMVLEIPKLDVSMSIVGVPQSDAGWDVNWLGENAGYLAGSAFPTWSGNTVITAHVWDAWNQPGPFSELKALKYGDQVQIHTWGLTYTYEVRDSNLVTMKNVRAVLQSEEYDWLTLVTCEFYNPFTGEYLFRRSVRAVLIDVR